MDEILSMADLQALVVSGETDWKQYGEVNANYRDGMVMFTYSPQCQWKPAGEWNWFELNSRGLILDTITGEVVARPFTKFFNYGQAMPAPNTSIIEVTEKIDGSFAVCYFRGGEWTITGHKQFNAPHIQWATPYLREELGGIPVVYQDWTFLFEAIHPDNRIVVDYRGVTDLVLIGARHRHNGEEMTGRELDQFAQKHLLNRPALWYTAEWYQLLELATSLPVNEEGWVVKMSDGQRFKIKGSAYLIVHQIVTGATFKRVLEAVEQGQFDRMIEGVPDEFLVQVRAWKAEIDEAITRIRYECRHVLEVAPQGTQKDFALWVQANYDKEYQSYLFAAKAGKPLEPLIYRKAFENRANSDVPVKADEA